MRTISRREALRWHGRRGELACDVEELAGAGSGSGSEFTAAAELRADVAAAVRRLDEGDRRLLLMQYWQEVSCAEVAERLGMPVGTVKIRLHRSRRRLAGLLAAAATDPAG